MDSGGSFCNYMHDRIHDTGGHIGICGYRKCRKWGGVRKLYEITFDKSTDTFTQDTTYHRYNSSKSTGSSNTLISADRLRVQLNFAFATTSTGTSIDIKLSDITSWQSGAVNINPTAMCPAYGQYGYVQGNVAVNSGQSLAVSCSIGESVWNSFTKAQILIYAV